MQHCWRRSVEVMTFCHSDRGDFYINVTEQQSLLSLITGSKDIVVLSQAALVMHFKTYFDLNNDAKQDVKLGLMFNPCSLGVLLDINNYISAVGMN